MCNDFRPKDAQLFLLPLASGNMLEKLHRLGKFIVDRRFDRRRRITYISNETYKLRLRTCNTARSTTDCIFP
jgi:hypothetical protein